MVEYFKNQIHHHQTNLSLSFIFSKGSVSFRIIAVCVLTFPYYSIAPDLLNLFIK